MKALIDEIYSAGVVYDELGNPYRLHSHIDRFEGEFIYSLISSDPNIHACLEIGCAYGISSLFIGSALAAREKVNYTIIDPYQSSHWHNVGRANLQRAGIKDFQLFEEPSEMILPELARISPQSYDFIFIDGMHTFDHALVDFFYANRLIKIGGHIAFDDCQMPSLVKLIAYVSKYPSYRRIRSRPPSSSGHSLKESVRATIRTLFPSAIVGHLLPKNFYDKIFARVLYPSLVVLRKVDDDRRQWNWFEPF